MLFRSIFDFDKATARFNLGSLHPGHNLQEVEAATGFTFAHAATVATTPVPRREELDLIRGPVREMLAETYPEVAATLG